MQSRRTCTPTSSRVAENWRRLVRPSWRLAMLASDSRIVHLRMATDSISAAWRLKRSRRRVTRRSTCPTYSMMAKHRSPCSPAERSCPAPSRGPISSRPTRPSHSRGRSTAHSTSGSFRYPTTSRSTRPTAAVRSARLLPPANAQRRSDASVRRIHFSSPRTRTRSWHALRTRSGPTRRTSRASGK